MHLNEIAQLIQTELVQVEQEIQNRLKTDNPLVEMVASHIFSSGGKRMRPTLLLLCSKLCDYSGDKDILYCSLIEYVHVATLLHDDVIDESKTRRGLVAANVKWGNNVAVLVGDYLYALSNIMLVEGGIPEALGLVSYAIMMMSDGELLEGIKKKDVTITEAEYLEIVTKKTAALFCVCCQIGAILGQKGKEAQEALNQYGWKLGIAFQMMDDVLDFVADEKKLGKPLGNDLKEGNLTIPIIRLLKKASVSEQERIKKIVLHPQGAADDLNFILNLLDRYQIIPAIAEDARNYISQAKQGLEIFPDSIYKEALLSIADYVITRDH